MRPPELALPTSGAVGFISRAVVWALIPAALLVTGFAHGAELAQARALLARARARVRAPAPVPVPRGASRPAVSVVMPFAGSRAEAEVALDALRALSVGAEDELILADNSGVAPATGVGARGRHRGPGDRRAVAVARPQRGRRLRGP